MNVCNLYYIANEENFPFQDQNRNRLNGFDTPY